jgi:hypothetical protein
MRTYAEWALGILRIRREDEIKTGCEYMDWIRIEILLVVMFSG